MPRQIYRMGQDIYNAATNSRIGATDWSQNWSGQSDVQDLGQRTQNIPASSVSNLASNQPNIYDTSSLANTNVNIPPQTTNRYDNARNVLDSSIGSTSNSLTSFLSQFDSYTKPAETERTGLVSKMNTAIDKLVGRGKRTQELMTEQQLPQNYEQLKSLNLQIAEKKAAYDKSIQAIEGKNIPMPFITGQQAQVQKMANIELGNMATLAQALQGNIELSRQMVNDTVNLEYADTEQEIENLQYQLTLNEQNMTSAEKKRAEAMSFALTERQAQLDAEKQEKIDIKNVAIEAAKNGASNDVAVRMMNAKSLSEAMQLGGSFLQTTQDKYMSVGKDSYIFDKSTGEFIANPMSEELDVNNTSDRLALVAQLGKMIYGSRISDAEREFMNNIITSKISENPSITNAELRMELMKQLTGYEVTKNEDIAVGLMDTILQTSGEEGISNFDMTGLAQLLNNNNVAGAITKVENYALEQQRKLDPQNYFGEAGASTTVTFANDLAKKIEQLGGIGNFQGSIEKWLGKFKGTSQQAIAADIVNMMATWRLRFAGSAVTPTEMQFLADSMPSITDRTDQIAVKLDSLQRAALTQYNQTRSSVNLPQLDQESLLNKGKRADLYIGGTTNENTESDIVTPEYESWLSQKFPYQSPNALDENLLFQYYKEKNPGVADDVIKQTIRDNLPSFNKDLSKSRNGSEVKKIASAIGQFESGGNYKAKGPTVTSGMYKGDNAYGKYQIMGKNIPQWSKEALGRSITLKEFLNNPKLQDQIAEYKMGNIYKQYGNLEDVASVWFSGRPVNKAGNAKDVLGTSVPSYVKNVRSIYNKLG